MLFSGVIPMEMYNEEYDNDLGVPSFDQLHKYVPAVSAFVCIVSFCICICVVIQRR